MKKKMVKAVALVMVVVLLVSLGGCGQKGDIKKLMSRFETACQSLDVEGIMDCLDPTIIKPLRSILGILGMGDLSGALGDVIDALGLTGIPDISSVDALQDLRLTPTDYSFGSDKTSCAVTTEIAYTLGGQEYTATVVLNCIQVDDVWYIGGIAR